MAKFVECSIPQVTYLRGDKITNHAVNIDLCKTVRKSRENWYPDNTGKPSIVFDGCDASWVYDKEDDRDADYTRLTQNMM